MRKFWYIRNKNERYRLKKYYKSIRRKKRNKEKIHNKNDVTQNKIFKFNRLFKDFIIPNYKPHYKNDKYNTILITIPKNFSLRDNYDESIFSISCIASLCKEKILRRCNLIHIDMKECERFDLDASCILDSIVDSLKYIAKNLKTDFKVDFSKIKNEQAYLNFLTTGFVNDEFFKTKDMRPVYELREKVSAMKKVKFVDFNKKKTKDAGLIVTDITDMILNGFENTYNYKNQLGNILGEIIDNIKEHSGNENPWYIAGNLLPKNEYNKTRIELVIMNYGLTFSQNLSNYLSNEENAKLYPKQFKKMQKSSERILNNQKGFIKKDTYDLEQVYTYILLQQGFSSKIVSDDNRSRRGSGIIKLLESIEKISDCSIKDEYNMILYSGSTCIKFLNKYKVAINNELGKGIKTICLNDKKSLFSKLDKNAVIKEKVPIPGTMIYLNFNLKEELDYE